MLGLDTCESNIGPCDYVLNGHFPLLPHKLNSSPITVPDDYMLRKVDSSIAPRDKSFLIYISDGTLIPLSVTILGMSIRYYPS